MQHSGPAVRHVSAAVFACALVLCFRANAGTLTPIYAFSKSEGRHTAAPVIDVGGALWGINQDNGPGPNPDDGTIFKITMDGSPAVILPFTGIPPGFAHANHRPYQPEGGLVQFGTSIFGTTSSGGAHNNSGVVFRISPSGGKQVIHDFDGGTGDGSYPAAKMISVGSYLYGTTVYGGAYDYGTVFRISPQGEETVIYSFNPNGGTGDGAYPFAPLVYADGALYGTTTEGGASDHGTVFSVTLQGEEGILWSLNGKENGSAPRGGLVHFGGKFYGTAVYGGKHDGSGLGTLFSVTKTGDFAVLHRFGTTSADGTFPIAGLVKLNGILYGTTDGGGDHNQGTIYSITPSGIETVLYSFKNRTDGANPIAPLIAVGGIFYGTTDYGGGKGQGGVFSFAP